MITVYLSLGTNLGDKVQALTRALDELRQAPEVTLTAVSPYYETPPWGKTDQPPFLNTCAAVRTSLTAEALLRLCQSIEAHGGRERHEKWGARTIDIDLVYSPDVTCASPDLQLPHPYLTQRAFVLVPLQDIAPDLVIQNRPLNAWLQELPERNAVVKAEGGYLWKKF